MGIDNPLNTPFCISRRPIVTTSLDNLQIGGATVNHSGKTIGVSPQHNVNVPQRFVFQQNIRHSAKQIELRQLNCLFSERFHLWPLTKYSFGEMLFGNFVSHHIFRQFLKHLNSCFEWAIFMTDTVGHQVDCS